MKAPLDELLRPITTPASWVYGKVVGVRNARFDRGHRVTKLDRPVISVGNITVGGVGKSPLVAWIARTLREAGHEPVIAMRGYRSREGALSDEQAEYLDRLEGINVLANPDRTAALREFIPGHPRIDCILLDDGFQHRFVHRDLDLVLIDATHEFRRDDLLPRGRLREPLANLARADAVIMTHASAIDDPIAARVESKHGKPPLAWTDHVWTHLDLHEDGKEARRVEVDWLRGKTLVTMLGVGKPSAVIDQLQRAGAKVMANIPAGDHEHYDAAKINVARGLCSGTEALVMTAKDWVKARSLIDSSSWPVPVIVPHLVLEFRSGGPELRDLVIRTVETHKSPGQSTPGNAGR